MIRDEDIRAKGLSSLDALLWLQQNKAVVDFRTETHAQGHVTVSTPPLGFGSGKTLLDAILNCVGKP